MLSDIKESSEPQYFVAKWIDFREIRGIEEHATFNISHFDMFIANDSTKFARMKICSADLHREMRVNIHLILRKDPAFDHPNNIRYEYQVEVLKCSRRNAAL